MIIELVIIMSSDEIDSAVIRIKGSKVVILLNEKKFSTGSTGFNGTGKLSTNNGKYQINVNVVLIGSKPESKETK